MESNYSEILNEMHGEYGYLDAMTHILNHGYEVPNERTGTGTIVSEHPITLHFDDVGRDFPLFTTKEVAFKMLAAEMLWMISGGTNANDIEDFGSKSMASMWNKWADDDGELGPIYGKQWRCWESYQMEEKIDSPEDYQFLGKRISTDQLQEVIEGIKDNPTSRRHIVSAWNPADIDAMNLPPCHILYIFNCEPLTPEARAGLINERPDKYSGDPHVELDKQGVPQYKLHLHLTQRSCDMLLGVPFNVAEYALLLLMVAQVTNTVPGNFTWTGVNCHIYQNHVEAVQTQLSRLPKSNPIVTLDDNITDIDEFTMDNIHLAGYDPHPAIKAPVSV